MNDIKHITKFKGSEAMIQLRNGDEVKGTLAFFNINDQTIHLNNFVRYSKDKRMEPVERGTIIIINRYSWYTLKIDEEEIKNE